MNVKEKTFFRQNYHVTARHQIPCSSYTQIKILLAQFGTKSNIWNNVNVNASAHSNQRNSILLFMISGVNQQIV